MHTGLLVTPPHRRRRKLQRSWNRRQLAHTTLARFAGPSPLRILGPADGNTMARNPDSGDRAQQEAESAARLQVSHVNEESSLDYRHRPRRHILRIGTILRGPALVAS